MPGFDWRPAVRFNPVCSCRGQSMSHARIRFDAGAFAGETRSCKNEARRFVRRAACSHGARVCLPRGATMCLGCRVNDRCVPIGGALEQCCDAPRACARHQDRSHADACGWARSAGSSGGGRSVNAGSGIQLACSGTAASTMSRAPSIPSGWRCVTAAERPAFSQTASRSSWKNRPTGATRMAPPLP